MRFRRKRPEYPTIGGMRDARSVRLKSNTIVAIGDELVEIDELNPEGISCDLAQNPLALELGEMIVAGELQGPVLSEETETKLKDLAARLVIREMGSDAS